MSAIAERTFEYVGTRPIRHDGLDKVTGRANYGADFALPGMLHGYVVRSPHAHARILSIDTSEAEAMPGVKAVLTGSDIPKTNAKLGSGEAAMDLGAMGDNALAHDKALYEGHAVAAVAATSPEIAREAAEKIKVEYEVLEPVMNVDRALAADAPILHEGLATRGQPLPDAPERTNLAMRMVLERGDLEKGFAEADVIVEHEFTTPMVHQGYIEPHACVARWGEDGQVLVWTTTQGHFFVRDACAGIMGLDAATLKVVPSEIGGGFGGKIPVYLEPVAIALSRKAHRPVKMVMSREDVFRATGPTSGTKIRTKIGAKKDGTLVAAHAQLYYEAGAYPGSPAGAGAMCAITPYTIPNFLIESHDVVVNRPKVAAYRAPGSPAAMFATESVLDEIAQKLDMDPIELRLKNAAEEGDQAPYGPKFGPIGLKSVLEAAKSHPHWKAPLGENQGRGFACGFWFNAGMNSTATVSLRADGSATVVTGNPDIGGTRVAQALMVSEELGIPVERVRPTVADTDSIGYNDLTGGSRVCYATGMAVIKAAQDVREQLCERAAKIWEVERSCVAWEHGRAIPLNGAGKNEPHDGGRAGRQDERHRGARRRAGLGPRAHSGTGLRRDDRGRRGRQGHRREPRGPRDGLPGRGQGRAPGLRRGPDAGRRFAGDRLGPQRGVCLRPGRPPGEPRLPRLPHAGRVGPAHDRHGDHRGAEPAPPVRRSRRRRGADRAAARGRGQRDGPRHGRALYGPAAVAAARAGGPHAGLKARWRRSTSPAGSPDTREAWSA